MPVKVKKEYRVGATGHSGDLAGYQDSGDRDAHAEDEEGASYPEDGGDDDDDDDGDGDEGDEGDETNVAANEGEDTRKFHPAFKLPQPDKHEMSVQQLYGTYPHCINN